MALSPYRIFISAFFLTLFGLVLIGRLFYIQVLNGQLYKALAQGQQNLFLEFQGKRGDILVQDARGNSYIIATTKEQTLCFLNKEKPGWQNHISEIALVLSIPKEELQKQIESSNSKRVLLTSDCSGQKLKKLKAFGPDFLEFESKFIRTYPQGIFSSDLLGFVGGEGKGQYGLEGFYDQVLKNDLSLIFSERNPWGFSWNITQNKKKAKANLVLTIDYNVQIIAEKLLKENVEKFKAIGGQIIVINPINGQIIALADYPTFDPNFYFKVKDQQVFKNGALQELFEPGSVFKPIVIAAGLETGKITPETSYEDKGFVKIGSYTIYNYDNRVYGIQTMRQVLEKSINTGAVFAQKQVGAETFLHYLKEFGFLEPSGIDLQGEIYSQNANLKTLRDINLATASFGQGIAITPIQLVRAFSAIANGGKLITPYVVKYIEEDGLKKEPQFLEERNVISKETSRVLTSMLLGVVEEGFGKGARIPGYYIAGKTGTAQVPWTSLGQNKPGYSDKTIQSFIGFFPAFDPKFLILVKLDHPQTKTAEYSSAPVFKELAEYLIKYYLIPPDYKP